MELASCHSSGAKNFDVVPRFLEKFVDLYNTENLTL